MRNGRADDWRDLVEAVRLTYGYATLELLRELGFERRRVDRLVTSGMLESTSYGLYRLSAQQDSWRSKLYRLTVETRSLASHLSCAFLHRLGRPADLSPGYAEATTSRRSRRSPEFAHRLYLHNGLDLTTKIVIDGIACRPVVPTLLDIARVHSIEAFTACFNEGVRRRLLTFDDLVVAYEQEPPGRRGSPAIRRAIEAVDGRAVAMSDWSHWAADRLTSAGLPAPELEAVLRDEQRRRIAQVDLYWPEESVVVELDSRAYHFDAESFARDRKRDALLAGVGVTVIRVTWEQYQDRDYFVDVVRRALFRAGPGPG